ncbi:MULTISPECIES: SDR family NAD(P)-dependent oxidoreductase [Streptosporangium]|uniref:SAM-dependent methyltransferase n=1 Tax=Streptosporangium brasiliense TaxID=47480 RepID=A0ABT9RJ28_9ACTN|nr:SDR family NAD(P)-dependent oxidoreductase [Streptosporangium brasiliense]MDP9869298.1 SAM-dependent methyltransferase [Streptosporangium brasiliense]
MTGAARGIGAAVAERLARDGLALAVIDLDEADCAGTVEAIRSEGGTALALAADVADDGLVGDAVARVVAEVGPPTVLVSNAGIGPRAATSPLLTAPMMPTGSVGPVPWSAPAFSTDAASCSQAQRASCSRAQRTEGEEMEGFAPRTSFGYEASKRYDAEDTRGDEEQTVAFLARLASGRDALEFAVGTGRIALPLRRTGVRVDGIELSPDMVDRMREKPDGDKIEVTMGDMSRVTTGRTYGLVYLVYNTIGNLLSQDDQVRCFENAARHLTGEGVFVVECRIPTAPARPGRQYVDAEHIGVDHVGLDVCRYDPVTQILDENHVRISTEGIVFGPIRLRLAHPPEFDLMARIAGLRLRERWGGWEREPYTAASWRHISVYGRPADTAC